MELNCHINVAEPSVTPHDNSSENRRYLYRTGIFGTYPQIDLPQLKSIQLY